MDLHLGYLSVLVVYFSVVLGIGIWAFRKKSYSAYVVAEHDMNVPLAVGTFLGTYISTATVIGFTGYITLSGGAIFSTYFWGFSLGWITLLLLSGKMRSLKLRSVPELFEIRYQSGFLRSMIAIFVIVSFAFVVATQLVAGSLVIETIVGIPQVVALLLLALIITVYTVLGGLIAVVRTDFIQVALLLLGILAAVGVVFWHLGGDVFTLRPEQNTLFAGSIGSSWDILAFTLVAWGGVSAQPYYLHRFYACRDVPTARQMIGIGALLAGTCYVAIVFLGLGLSKLLPEDSLGDSAVPTFALQEGGLLGVLLLVSIMCAVQSSLDAALHLAGVYSVEDVIARYRTGMDDRARLRASRVMTAIFGVICAVGALYFVVSGGGLIVTLLNYWLGTLTAALLLPLLAALFWPRATAVGATLSSVGGFVAYFGTLLITTLLQTTLPFHPIFLGLGTALVLLVGASLLTRPVTDESVLERFFGSDR